MILHLVASDYGQVCLAWARFLYGLMMIMASLPTLNLRISQEGKLICQKKVSTFMSISGSFYYFFDKKIAIERKKHSAIIVGLAIARISMFAVAMALLSGILLHSSSSSS